MVQREREALGRSVDGVLSYSTCREIEMMVFEGEVAVRSNADRRFRPENNENIHLTME